MSYLANECTDWLKTASISDLVATCVGMCLTAVVIHLFIFTAAVFGTPV
jgi:hypothetical protein